MKLVSLLQAKELLKKHEVVAIATETVFGLAASIDSEQGLRKIFKVKERPFYDPLIIHCADIEQIRKLGINLTPLEEELANQFWPGPLSMIFKTTNAINPLITAGLDTVAIRIPNQSSTLELLKIVGPLAAPSANKFSKTSPTSAQHVFQEFNTDVAILENQIHYQSSIGIESTIIQVKNDTLLLHRPGMLSRDILSNFLKTKNYSFTITEIKTDLPLAPGQIKHHYCPRFPLWLIHDESEIQFCDSPVWRLPDDPGLVARLLYQKLRDFDELLTINQKLDNIKQPMYFIIQKEFYDLAAWEGIINRLNKAKSN